MEQHSRIENTEKQYSEENNNVNSLQAGKVSKENNTACKMQNLGTRIPSDILRKFRVFVLAKHDKLNGPFSQEVTKALVSWMNNQQQTTSFTFSLSKTGRPRADKIEKYRRIVMQLKQLTTFPCVNHFTLIHTVEAVLGVCDKRTFYSYLKDIKKLSKETPTPFGVPSMLDVSRFVEKVQSDDW